MAKHWTILLVEDDSLADVLHLILRRNLREASIFLARDGEEGLRLALTMQPDLIICDLTIPGIDGYDLIKRLSPARQNKCLHIIGMSGGHPVDTRMMAFQKICDKFFPKPFEAHQLLSEIKRFMTNAVTS
jgi:DNA-binding response OmpR family regulator